jgi:hypothetical protein
MLLQFAAERKTISEYPEDFMNAIHSEVERVDMYCPGYKAYHAKKGISLEEPWKEDLDSFKILTVGLLYKTTADIQEIKALLSTMQENKTPLLSRAWRTVKPQLKRILEQSSFGVFLLRKWRAWKLQKEASS